MTPCRSHTTSPCFMSSKATLVALVSRSLTLRSPSCLSLSAEQAVGITDPGNNSQISLNSQHTSRVHHQGRCPCESAKQCQFDNVVVRVRRSRHSLLQTALHVFRMFKGNTLQSTASDSRNTKKRKPKFSIFHLETTLLIYV